MTTTLPAPAEPRGRAARIGGRIQPATAEWQLWSTTARVVVTDPALLERAVRLVRAELGEVEAAVSRFHEGSELRRLNAGAFPSIGWPTEAQLQRAEASRRLAPVSDAFARYLQVALDAARRTQGAVDPTVGASLRTLGYDRDIALVRAAGVRDDDGDALAPAPGWQSVQLHGRGGNRWVSLPVGAELDLGATAKAAAADRCAALVADALGCGVLVSLGGDIATAGPSPRGGWQVDVADRAGDPPCRVALHGVAGLATSSTRRRAWRRVGSDGVRTVHHIVDPATGASARSPWGAVSVVASSCALANAASTATIVAGERGHDWLHETGLAARLVDDAGTDIRLGGWPSGDPTVAATCDSAERSDRS